MKMRNNEANEKLIMKWRKAKEWINISNENNE